MADIFQVHSTITKTSRNKLNDHKSFCIWFTGLPSSGKSSIAIKTEEILFARKVRTYILDGDNLRHGLNKNLGFSPEDRKENIRRTGEVARLLVDAGIVVLTAFISPYIEDRNRARSLFNEGEFIEVFVKTSLKTCEARDTKGLYKKARERTIKEFTGISAPYEEPVNPELIIDTDLDDSIENNAMRIIYFIDSRFG